MLCMNINVRSTNRKMSVPDTALHPEHSILISIPFQFSHNEDASSKEDY